MIDGIGAVFAPSGEESEAAKSAVSDEMSMAMMNYMPLRGMLSFGGDKLPEGFMDQLLEQLNALND